MSKHKLSALGFFMERLNVQTVALSRALHVDASLVSKWKSGDRCLNSKSIYFDDIIQFLMQESKKSSHQVLKKALAEVSPLESIGSSESPEPFLRQLLSNPKMVLSDFKKPFLTDAPHTTQVSIYEQNAGRRHAIDKLLSFAEEIPTPGQILFIDSEEYGWLLEDKAFSRRFVHRMIQLLDRGFTAKFVIHFSSYRERFLKFFEICNVLLFHRNVEWYYYEYYDENVFNFSFFILNKAISLLGLSANQSISTTMIFTDTNSIIQHQVLADSVILKCQKLFMNFAPGRCSDVVKYISAIRKRGALYAYLPAPAFVSAETDLLCEILGDNHIEASLIEHCICINHLMRSLIHSQFRGLEDRPERIIQIFQLEEMIRRAKKRPFISCSLTLLGGKSVQVSQVQYARCIRNLAASLEKYNNLEIAFVSEADNIPLPNINEMNCWCKQNTWMVQMDHQGFRLTDEVSIVNSASITLERCLRKIPPERKEKEYVVAFLLNFANNVEEDTL